MVSREFRMGETIEREKQQPAGPSNGPGLPSDPINDDTIRLHTADFALQRVYPVALPAQL